MTIPAWPSATTKGSLAEAQRTQRVSASSARDGDIFAKKQGVGRIVA
jgi:hypothetical protein